MNKEENLTFGGRSLVDEGNHVYQRLDVYYLYYVFDVYYFFMSLDVLGQSLYLLWYKWWSDLSMNVLNAKEKIVLQWLSVGTAWYGEKGSKFL